MLYLRNDFCQHIFRYEGAFLLSTLLCLQILSLCHSFTLRDQSFQNTPLCNYQYLDGRTVFKFSNYNPGLPLPQRLPIEGAHRRTLHRVNRRSRTKSWTLKAYFWKYETKKLKSGFTVFFLKFPFKNTHWNWICDEINIRIWNFSQKLNVWPLLLACSTVARCDKGLLVMPCKSQVLQIAKWKCLKQQQLDGVCYTDRNPWKKGRLKPRCWIRERRAGQGQTNDSAAMENPTKRKSRR